MTLASIPSFTISRHQRVHAAELPVHLLVSPPGIPGAVNGRGRWHGPGRSRGVPVLGFMMAALGYSSADRENRRGTAGEGIHHFRAGVAEKLGGRSRGIPVLVCEITLW